MYNVLSVSSFLFLGYKLPQGSNIIAFIFFFLLLSVLQTLYITFVVDIFWIAMPSTQTLTPVHERASAGCLLWWYSSVWLPCEPIANENTEESSLASLVWSWLLIMNTIIKQRSKGKWSDEALQPWYPMTYICDLRGLHCLLCSSSLCQHTSPLWKPHCNT